MRLLSPKEARAKRDGDQERLSAKLIALQSQISGLNKELEELRASFKREQIALSEDLNDAIALSNAKRRELQSDITFLEERKRLIEESTDEKAWTMRHEVIELKEKALIERELEISAKESHLEVERERLESKAQEIKDWAIENELKTNQIQEEKEKLRSFEGSLIEKENALKEAIREFTEEKQKQNAFIAESLENIQSEISLLNVKKEQLNEDRKKIDKERKAVLDGYKALEQAKKHLKLP